MSEVTRILDQIQQGRPCAAEALLPVVYEELRRLAARKLAHEPPGQSLQATALVHEAYLRLVDCDSPQPWENRRHFFAAAAEAMRRILVERARRRQSLKRGGAMRRIDLNDALTFDNERSPEILALDEALEKLERHDPQAAALVKLRYFAGLTHQQAAAALGIGRRAADRLWSVARAWLYQQIAEIKEESSVQGEPESRMKR